MARYEYRCACSRHIEHSCPMGEAPATVACQCGGEARRVFLPPAAIHFHGPGFYATDVRGRVARKRRPNPGDDLHREFDTDAAKIHAGI